MRTMPKLLILGLIFTLASPVMAERNRHHGKNHFYYDHAKVINVEPIYERVQVPVSQKSCWIEKERQPVRRQVYDDRAEKILVGGIIGGVIGHQLGHRGGGEVATIAGTLIGAAVGHDQANQGYRQEYYIQDRERCRTYTDYRSEERPAGFRVTYRYHGEIFHTQMDRHPGKRVRVRVNIDPVR